MKKQQKGLHPVRIAPTTQYWGPYPGIDDYELKQRVMLGSVGAGFFGDLLHPVVMLYFTQIDISTIFPVRLRKLACAIINLLFRPIICDFNYFAWSTPRPPLYTCSQSFSISLIRSSTTIVVAWVRVDFVEKPFCNENMTEPWK